MVFVALFFCLNPRKILITKKFFKNFFPIKAVKLCLAKTKFFLKKTREEDEGRRKEEERRKKRMKKKKGGKRKEEGLPPPTPFFNAMQ